MERARNFAGLALVKTSGTVMQYARVQLHGHVAVAVVACAGSVTIIP